jgi:recombination DNA repair RAD52 pathway protein
MGDTVADKLAAPFPPAMLRTVSKGGSNLSYIPVAEVIVRLNDVLGFDGWSYRVVERWSAGEWEGTTGTYPEWCMAHVRLVIGEQCHDGIGGVQVKRLSSGNGPVDMGDEWKGAVSDALKKAAQAFGVGLDIARKDEAKAADALASEQEQANALAREHGWTTADERNAEWNRLAALSKELPDDEQAQIKREIKKAGFTGADFTKDNAKWWAELIALASPALSGQEK